jgi:NADH-quinone oxidoreductase subunit L
MSTTQILWLLPAFPLVSFLLIVLVTNRSRALSHTIAIAAAALAFAGSITVFIRALGPDLKGFHHLGEHPINQAIAWFATGDTTFNIGVQLDPLTALMLFFVGFTVLGIFIYSVGYHNFGQPKGDHDAKGLPPHGATVTDEHGHRHVVPSIEPNYSRFFAFISLFAAGMYLLVVSDNLLTLFVGWEIMGLCSYLLIGFWFAKDSAKKAAVKAFMTTRIGDVFMLLGLVYLYSKAGSLSYSVIFAEEFIQSLAESDYISSILGLSAGALIGILLLIGTIGKSAQFPLHVWLPDAMEGPTPVSAMIHAATMVSAGVYMVIRIFPILQVGSGEHSLSPAMTILAIIGCITALMAATIAVAQNDIKRVLAYSTISQLGFMIAALGIGAYVAAAFHLMTHAFFKALLFLGSGSVIHGMEHGVLHTGNHEVDPQDMINMGGLRKRMPVTFWTFLIGGMALSGLPFITAGFWSKDEILAEAFYVGSHGTPMGWVVLIVLAVSALLTAFYTMRQITLTFFGEPRTEEAKHAHETPWTMTFPLVVLAVFAIAVGWAGIPDDFPVIGGILPNLVHGVVDTLYPAGLHLHTPEFSPIPLLISIGVAVLGLLGGYALYRNYFVESKDPMQRMLGPLHKVLENKYYFDEIYSATFVRLSHWLSEVFAFKWIDRGLIDGGILHGVSRFIFWLGGVLRTRIEMPIINDGADYIAQGVRKLGFGSRFVQSGKVQQYMIMVLAIVVIVGAMFLALLS